MLDPVELVIIGFDSALLFKTIKIKFEKDLGSNFIQNVMSQFLRKGLNLPVRFREGPGE